MTEPNMILAGVVGSTAYGMNHANSDTDMLGVYVAPTREVLGLHDVEQSKVGNDPDWQAHELGKAFKLWLSCNPTASEILWLPDALYAIKTPMGESLINMRESFLSDKAFYSFGGYATQQFRRLRDEGNFSSDKRTPDKVAKHARHLVRLVHQGIGLMLTGQLRVRLDSDTVKRCFAIGDEMAELERLRLSRDDKTLTEDEKTKGYAPIADLMDLYENTHGDSILPDKPNLDVVNDALVRLRISDLVGT